MDHVLKSLLNLLLSDLVLCSCFVEMWVSTPWPGIEPMPLALEGKVWTTGLQEVLILFYVLFMISLRIKYPADEQRNKQRRKIILKEK